MNKGRDTESWAPPSGRPSPRPRWAEVRSPSGRGRLDRSRRSRPPSPWAVGPTWQTALPKPSGKAQGILRDDPQVLLQRLLAFQQHLIPVLVLIRFHLHLARLSRRLEAAVVACQGLPAIQALGAVSAIVALLALILATPTSPALLVHPILAQRQAIVT